MTVVDCLTTGTKTCDHNDEEQPSSQHGPIIYISLCLCVCEHELSKGKTSSHQIYINDIIVFCAVFWVMQGA